MKIRLVMTPIFSNIKSVVVVGELTQHLHLFYYIKESKGMTYIRLRHRELFVSQSPIVTHLKQVTAGAA